MRKGAPWARPGASRSAPLRALVRPRAHLGAPWRGPGYLPGGKFHFPALCHFSHTPRRSDPIPIHPSTLSFSTAWEQDSRPFGVEAGLHPRLHPLVAGWRIVSIPAAIPMRPSPSEGDGRTSPPPYLGHAIPSPSQRGWTGTDASVLFGWDGNGSPYLLGWRSASIPASIPSFWDGELSPSLPPSPRTPSPSDGDGDRAPQPRSLFG